MDSHLLRLRLDASIDGNFAALVIDEAPYVKGQILMAGKGSIMQGLNSSMVKELILALPPLAEQTSILHFLNEATSSILETIDRTQREIELLHEYRTRLVADIVTGKLDVREAAAKLPEELKIDETEEVDEAEISDEEIAV
jgi:type I restriction enzyme S subunit